MNKKHLKLNKKQLKLNKKQRKKKKAFFLFPRFLLKKTCFF